MNDIFTEGDKVKNIYSGQIYTVMEVRDNEVCVEKDCSQFVMAYADLVAEKEDNE